MAAKRVKIKRVYDPPAASDGYRVLVDRLWPRGLTKEAAAVDLWLRDVAPSTELRKWFHHEAQKWSEFRERYEKELRANPDAVARLRDVVRTHAVTLVYGAKDEEHNQAAVLRDFLAGTAKAADGR